MKRAKKLYILLGILVAVCAVTFGVSRYSASFSAAACAVTGPTASPFGKLCTMW